MFTNGRNAISASLVSDLALEHLGYDQYAKVQDTIYFPNEISAEERDTLVRLSSQVRDTENLGLSVGPGSGIQGLYHTADEPTDITIQLELDAVYDFSEDMEELFRLRRLGNFAEAQTFLRSRFDQHFNDPYVLIQQAEILLEMGDQSSLRKYMQDSNETFLDSLSRCQMNDLLKFLPMVWTLIRAIHEASSDEGWVDLTWFRSLDFEFQDANIWDPAEQSMSSTKVKILALMLRADPNLHHIASTCQGHPWTPISARLGQVDWPRVARHLFRQGRVWELRDLFVSAISTYGTAAEAMFFGTSIMNLVEPLGPWHTHEQDSSTNLAMLDMCINRILFVGLPSEEQASLKLMEFCEKVVSSDMQLAPEYLRSRIFSQWLIVKSIHDISPTGLPRYVFHQGQTQPEKTKFESDRALRLALKLSKQLHDHRTQSMCLLVLLDRTEDAERKELLAELLLLQREKQVDEQNFVNRKFSWGSFVVSREEYEAAILLVYGQSQDQMAMSRGTAENQTGTNIRSKRISSPEADSSDEASGDTSSDDGHSSRSARSRRSSAASTGSATMTKAVVRKQLPPIAPEVNFSREDSSQLVTRHQIGPRTSRSSEQMNCPAHEDDHEATEAVDLDEYLPDKVREMHARAAAARRISQERLAAANLGPDGCVVPRRRKKSTEIEVEPVEEDEDGKEPSIARGRDLNVTVEEQPDVEVGDW